MITVSLDYIMTESSSVHNPVYDTVNNIALSMPRKCKLFFIFLTD